MEKMRRTMKAYIIVICMFTVMSFVFAAIINFTGFKEIWTFSGLIVMLSLSAAAIGVLEGNIIGKKGILAGLLAAFILLFIIVTTVSGIFGMDSERGVLNGFYIIPLVAGSIGGVIGVNCCK